jgi:hypothetical protein
MLIQRGGATMHRVLDESTRFTDFIELVSFENFEKDILWNREHKEVQVPHSGTTYTMLEVAGAVSC